MKTEATKSPLFLLLVVGLVAVGFAATLVYCRLTAVDLTDVSTLPKQLHDGGREKTETIETVRGPVVEKPHAVPNLALQMPGPPDPRAEESAALSASRAADAAAKLAASASASAR